MERFLNAVIDLLSDEEISREAILNWLCEERAEMERCDEDGDEYSFSGFHYPGATHVVYEELQPSDIITDDDED